MTKALLSLVFCLVFVGTAVGAPPRIFFTDLISGPNTGGENNNGTILSIYGKGFGTARGTSTVTLGGGAVAAYLQWGVPAPGEGGTQKISVAVGAAALTGDVVVTVNGIVSNGVPFTVRAGTIRCVSTTGSDTNNGKFTTDPTPPLGNGCWATLVNAKNVMVAGEITYALNNVSATTVDPFCNISRSPVLCMSAGVGPSSGTTTNPIAMVAYPGAIVTINGPIEDGIRVSGINGWVLAGMILRTSVGATGSAWNIDFPGDNWRIIANEVTCPSGNGASACIETSRGTNIKFLGNFVHDTSPAGASKLYHGVYFSTESDHIEAGWNTVRNVRGCRGFHFHSSPIGAGSGLSQFDLIVHDNIIHDTVCDGIDFHTVAPQNGPVQAYNNIIYRTGTGPDPPDGSSDYACIFSADGTNAGTPGSGNIDIFNNTMFDCGCAFSPCTSNRGTGCLVKDGSNPNLFMRTRNNVCLQPRTGELYLGSGVAGAVANIIGNNNDWFGIGTLLQGTEPQDGIASGLVAPELNVDPLLVSAPVGGVLDAHLQSTSPAIGAGTTAISPITDFDGLIRPTPPSLGGYEFTAGVGAPAVSLLPSPVAFGNQQVGTSSSSTAIILTNSGTATLTITAISIVGVNPGQFSQTNNCPVTLGAGLNCTVTVVFTPTVLGPLSATLSVTDNAAGSPHTDALSGTGVGSGVALTPGNFDFSIEVLSVPSAAQSFLLSNNGSAALVINSIGFTGLNAADFSQTNNCTATLAVGATCTINVVFLPVSTSYRFASLSVSDNGPGSPHTSALAGFGANPAQFGQGYWLHRKF